MTKSGSRAGLGDRGKTARYDMGKSLTWQTGLCLGASIVAMACTAPALGAVIDYPNGTDRTTPILLTDNATQLQVITGSAIQSGVISETGGPFQVEQIGNGQLILTGNNTYTGGTIISGGALLVGNGGTTGSIMGDVVVGPSTAGPGINFDRSDDITFSGNISGLGYVAQYGAGMLTLTGNNTYSGGTTILSGTLAVSGDSNLGSGPVKFDGGNLRFLSSTNSTLAYELTSGAFDTNGNFVILSGVLSTQVNTNVAGGYGGLTKIGAGTLFLAGANTYLGPTVISAGTLQIGTSAALGAGNLVDDGTLHLNGINASIASLSGSGSVIGGSTLTLTNASGTFTGTLGQDTPMGLVVAGGTETLTGEGRFSTVTINAGAGLVLSGTGALGAGSTLTDDGVFDISAVTAGTSLQFLTGSGTINLGNQTLTLANPAGSAFNSTFSGVITGTGGVIITGGAGGSGAVRTFAGANTYSGATIIQSGGTLILGQGGSIALSTVQDAGTLSLAAASRIKSLSGSGVVVLADNTLTLGNAGDTFSGVIQGGAGGSLTIAGGSETLAGANSYGGGTFVNSGTLNVTGTIGAVNVASGGTLTGTGKVGAVTIASGGTLIAGAGSAPGTLTVQGNLALASGATYVANISPSVTGLTNVTGSAALDGALAINAVPGTYAAGHYTLLSATGGVSGTFSSVTTTGLNAYKTTLGYDSNSVFLTFKANALTPLLPPGSGVNTLRAAKAIDTAVAGGAVVNSGFNTLFGLSGSALGSAMTQIAGDTSADAAQAASQAFAPFVSMLMAQGAGGSDTLTASNFAPDGAYGDPAAPKPAQAETGGMRAWGAIYGGHTGIAADTLTGAQSLKTGNAGFAGGIEIQASEKIRLGAAVGFGHNSFNAGNGRGASDDVMLGIYGTADILDRGYVAGALAYGWHDIDTLRTIAISGTDRLQAQFDAQDVGGRIESGWRLSLDDASRAVPFAAFAWNNFQAPAYGETAQSGSANFALSYAAHDSDFGHSELGMKLGHDMAIGGNSAKTEITAAWAHELFGAPFALASFQALPGSNFLVQGARVARDTALLGAGVEVRTPSGFAYGARIDSRLGGGTTALAGTANLAFNW
jgi:autotransporter-associated beta strand protein